MFYMKRIKNLNDVGHVYLQDLRLEIIKIIKGAFINDVTQEWLGWMSQLMMVMYKEGVK